MTELVSLSTLSLSSAFTINGKVTSMTAASEIERGDSDRSQYVVSTPAIPLRLLFLGRGFPSACGVQAASGELCPDHWIDATLSGLGCLYFNSSATVSWLDASAWCQAPENNATLVEIWTELQLDFIRSELLFLQDNGVDYDWWTGATDLGREGDWYWAGSLATVGEFLFDQQQDQPDGGTSHNCLKLQDAWGFTGDDVECLNASFSCFICQKK